MLKYLVEPVDSDSLDRSPFQFKHRLVEHPALTLENLARVLPALPPDQVMYSKKLQDLRTNFERAHIDHQNGLSIEETIEHIRTSESYISVRKPESHPSFQPLFAEINSDVGELMRKHGTGTEPVDPQLWLFIASPNALTPFHFDRYSNFLMQIRGSKQVAVFRPWNAEVIDPADYEARVAFDANRADWRPEKDRFAIKFNIVPGDAIHIPFLGGHYVQNGPEDVSITLSYFFHNNETTFRTKALLTNHFLRKRLKRVGLQPRPIGASAGMDALKAGMYPLLKAGSEALGAVRKKLGLAEAPSGPRDMYG
jgi:cupin-like protein